jgi:hypothetical protein
MAFSSCEGVRSDNLEVLVEQLLAALISSANLAADDVLVEALRLGTEDEKWPVLEAILQRRNVRSLCGIIELYDKLPEPLQRHALENIKLLHQALREAGRSENMPLRLAALRLIALGRQGKLAYVLSENLHSSTENVSKSATEAMVALARWIATESKRLNRGEWLRREEDAETRAHPSPRPRVPASPRHLLPPSVLSPQSSVLS